MTSTTDGRPRVLIVDDEAQFAELAAVWLESSYGVETATGGDEALEHLDESIDVVLLDRRMPGISGDEVLDEIRDRETDCRVVMVTAVEPDIDILDLGFDDYLVKPVTEDEINAVIDEMLERAAYDEHTQEFFALVSKKSALETSMTQAELGESEAYAELNAQLERVSNKMDHAREELLAGQESKAIFREPQEWH